jgi:hypothetical protein
MTGHFYFVRVAVSEGRAMEILLTVIVFAFVLGVLAVVAYALFEASPFAHHVNEFRDPRTGRRRGESPHLD